MIRFLALAAVLMAGTAAAAEPAGDADAGAAIFKQRCGICHSNAAGVKKPMGPNLFGVVGRKAATDPGFRYTPALTKSGLTWTPAALDTFIAAPTKAVPGVAMVMALPAEGDRADVIAYLKTLK